MRFTIQTIPFGILVFLPIFVAYYGYGLVLATVWVLLGLVLRQAIVMYTLLTSDEDDKRIILNTQAVSHYVEKARWCMEKSGIDFVEEKDIGILGRLLVGRSVPTLYAPGKNITISNSADILRYVYAIQLPVNPDRVRFLKPCPETARWESKFDKMGEDLRRYCYYHALKVAQDTDEFAFRAWGMEEETVPYWQKVLLETVITPLKAVQGKLRKITREGAEEGLRLSREVFHEVEEALGNNAQKYILGTEEPTYIDYVFASLAAILAFPDNYGGPKLNPRTRLNFATESDRMGTKFKVQAEKFRASIAGQFVLRMYREHR